MLSKVTKCITLLLSFLVIISGQTIRSVSVSSKPSPIQKTNFSINALSTQLQAVTQESVNQLEQNPSDLNRILEDIAQAIISELESLALALVRSSGFDTDTVVQEFGNAVNQSFSSLEFGDVFDQLNVSSIVAEVENSVEEILLDVDQTSDARAVTEELGNAVVGAIGNGFLQVMGATFSFVLSVTQSSSSTSLSPNFSVRSADMISQQVAVDLQTGRQDNVLEVLTLASSDLESYQTVMEDVFVSIFSDGMFPVNQLAETLGVVYEINVNITIILEQAIIRSSASSEKDGLIKLIAQSVTTNGQTQEVVLYSVGQAIEVAGCTTALAEVLVQSNKDAAQHVQDFEMGVGDSASVSQCLSEGLERQASLSAFAFLSDGEIEQAFQTIRESQVSTIVSTFVFAIEEGLIQEVTELVSIFFKDKTITTKRVTLVIALFVTQERENVTQILVDYLSNTELTDNYIDAFKYALTEAERGVREAFVSLLASSVIQNECQLLQIMQGVFKKSTPEEVDIITKQLEQGGVEQCLSPRFAQAAPDVEELDRAIVSETSSPISFSVQQSSSKNSNQNGCIDIEIPGDFTCAQQAAFGKCERLWMINGRFCAKTCNRCCEDVQPNQQFSCAQQKQFGKCKAAWMINGGFCRQTCGRCDLIASESTTLPSKDYQCSYNCPCLDTQSMDDLTASIVATALQILQSQST